MGTARMGAHNPPSRISRDWLMLVGQYIRQVVFDIMGTEGGILEEVVCAFYLQL